MKERIAVLRDGPHLRVDREESVRCGGEALLVYSAPLGLVAGLRGIGMVDSDGECGEVRRVELVDIDDVREEAWLYVAEDVAEEPVVGCCSQREDAIAFGDIQWLLGEGPREQERLAIRGNLIAVQLVHLIRMHLVVVVRVRVLVDNVELAGCVESFANVIAEAIT